MALEQSVHSIPRLSLSSLTLDIFAERFQKPGTLLIITELLNSEVDCNLNYLCEQLNSQEFLLRYYGHERYKQDKREWTSIGSGVPPKCILFREYANLLRTHEAHEQDIYLAKCPITNTPLAKTQVLQSIDEQLKQLGLNQSASSFNLGIGPGGHVECLHYDPTDGVLIQLHGTKRVVLFPPSQMANLYPYPIHVHLRHGLKED
ncbi:MAG: cupin-like domain-containing protein [Tolypothrix sp. T3-bin4]|nr:cupin-like domain-containing protein [Tolypothrix sp. T3-bin4]